MATKKPNVQQEAEQQCAKCGRTLDAERECPGGCSQPTAAETQHAIDQRERIARMYYRGATRVVERQDDVDGTEDAAIDAVEGVLKTARQIGVHVTEEAAQAVIDGALEAARHEGRA